MARKIEEQNTPESKTSASEDGMWSQIHKNAIKSRDNLKKLNRIKKAKEYELSQDNPQ